MSRSGAYRKAKSLAASLNVDLGRTWPSGSLVYWNNKIDELNQIQIQNEQNAPYTNFDEDLEAKNYQKIIDEFVESKQLIEQDQATELLDNMITSGRYVLEFTTKDGKTSQSKKLMLTPNSYKDFLNLLTSDFSLEEGEAEFSGGEIPIDVKNIENIKIEKLDGTKKFFNNMGGFFPFYNNTKLDLSRYQIFKQGEISNKDVRENCLIHSLKCADIDESLINNVKLAFVNNSHIKSRDLQKVANIIGRTINLKKFYEDTLIKSVYKTKEPNDKPIVKLAIFKNHYFIDEQTMITRFALNNYDKLNHLEDFENITLIREFKTKTSYQRKPSQRKIDSISMVKILYKADKFIAGDMSNFVEKSENKDTKDLIYLGNIEEEQKITQKKKINKKMLYKPHEIFYGDIETYTNGENHELQLIGVADNDDDSNYVPIFNVCDGVYEGHESPEKSAVRDFLNYVTKNGKQNALCYFHNLKYDYNIIEKYISIIQKCQKDGQIYNVLITHKSKKVELRDSLKMIAMPLSKFGKTFDLPAHIRKKEAIAYGYYTKLNNGELIKPEKYRKLLPISDQKIFDEVSIPFIKKGLFNPLKYYKDYLKLDCLVLKQGIKKFTTIIDQATNGKTSVPSKLSISSLSDTYFINSGAYELVYQVNGNLREYIGKAVYGGRVSVNPKYQMKEINGKLLDFDACSLYPSAIYRLCQETGLPTGKAKRFDPTTQNWRDYIYCVLTVKITKVNKHQQIPFIAHKSKGSTQYLNEPPSENIVIDKITLEDYINFQGIEYEIIDGVYWSGVGNRQMGESIKKLYDERLMYKKQGNQAMQQAIKLMLNSAYGKTVLRKSFTKTSFVKNNTEEYNNYIFNNFNTIRSSRDMNNGKSEIEEIDSDASYNRAHIGAMILSMSKRIMNEVFDIANSNNIPFYYTDTDSIHMNFDDEEKLRKLYNKKYNRELVGKNLCQFHGDFDLDGAVSDIYATTSIFVNKKVYLDILESTNKDGEKINGYHIRLKGITTEGLAHEAKKYENSYLGLFRDLINEKEIKFYLNPFDKENNKEKTEQ